MSRYLEYSEPSWSAFQARGEPEGLGPCCLRRLGGKRFKEYVVDDYQGSIGVCAWGLMVHSWPVQTTLCIFVPALAYYYYVLPLALPPGQPIWASAFGCVQSVLGIITATSFVLAAFMNPGIVPRKIDTPRDLELDAAGKPRARYLLIRHITIKQKFCRTCKIFRPPRSKHCQHCDNCVLRFDHHCTWLGNCVGLNNYSVFVTLIYSSTAFLVLIIGTTIFVLNSDTDVAGQGDEAIENELGVVAGSFLLVALLIYCVFLMTATLLLSVYHTVIVSQNLTTNEHVKGYYYDNPFDFGPSANFAQVFCHPERVLAEGLDYIQPSKEPQSSWEDSMSYDDD